MSTNPHTYHTALGMADSFLAAVAALSWDDLGDTNSLWEYIDDNMSDVELRIAAEDAATDRLREDGFPMDILTS